MQTLLTVLIVLAATGYMVRQWMPSAWRAVLRGRLAHHPTDPQPPEQDTCSACGTCGGCARG